MAGQNVKFVIEADSSGAVTRVLTFKSALEEVGTAGQTASTKVISSFDRMEMVLKKMQSAVIGLVGAFLFREAVRGIYDIIEAGVSFDAAFAGIRKTVGGTAVELGDLSDQLRKMALDIPIGVDALAKIAETGGKLGVPISQIKEFTQSIAQMGVVTGVSGEETATQMQKLAEVMHIPVSQFKNLESVLVKLGSERFPTTTAEILAFSQNISGAAMKVGLTIDQVFGLSTALASVGLRSEKAGSSITRIFQEMGIAVDTQSPRLQNFAAVAGMSADEFGKAFKDNAGKALLSFLSGLNDAGKAGENMDLILKTVGLDGLRVADVTIRGAMAAKTFAEATAVSESEAKRLGATLDEKTAVALDNTQAKLNQATGRIHDVFISLSEQLQPALVKGAQLFAGLAEAARDYAGATVTVGSAITAFIAVAAGVKIAEWTIAFIGASDAVIALRLAMIGGATASEAFALATTGAMASAALLAAPLAAALAGVLLLRSAWNDEAEAADKAADASLRLRDNLMKHAKELEEHGIKITSAMVKQYGWIGALRLGDIELKNQEDSLKKSAAALKLITDAEQKLQEAMEKRIKAMVDSVDKSKSAKELEIALERLNAEGASGAEIMKKFGKEAVETAASLRAMSGPGGIANVPVEIAKLAAAVENADITKSLSEWRAASEKAGTQIQQDFAKMVVETDNMNTSLKNAFEEDGRYFEDILTKYGAAASKLQKDMFDMGQGVPPVLSMVANAFDAVTMKIKLTGDQTGDLADKLNNLRIPVGMVDLVKNSNPWIFQGPTVYQVPPPPPKPGSNPKQEAKEYAEINKGIEKSMDKLFENLVKKGQLAWKDIGSFASEVFESMSNELFKPLREKLLTPLANGLGQVASKLTSSLTGVDKDGKLTGIFGGLGKKLGGVMGSLASAGIGAAIGVGLNLLSGLLKKSGSEVNNNLVKDIQNPFTDAVGKLHDSFIEAQKSGKLTLDTAVAMRGQMEGMLSKFKEDAAAYASLGAKQSTAVSGMFATISQYWGTDLADIFAKLDGAIQDLGGNAGMTVAQLADMNKQMAEDNAFNDAVNKLTDGFTVAQNDIDVLAAALNKLQSQGVPADVIIAQLGATIEDMTARMKTANEVVPQIISDYDTLIRAQEDAANRLAQSNAFDDAVNNLIDGFSVAQKNVDELSTALYKLQAQGVPAFAIVAQLGGTISDMASRMRAANETIPSIIANYDNLIRSQNAFTAAQAAWAAQLEAASSKLQGVSTELDQVGRDLDNALISKLGMLDSEIAASQQAILGWQSQIKSLDSDIADMRKKLEDTAYWQQRYTDYIKDAETALQDATDKRKSIEEQIASLAEKVEEERLKNIIKTSKNSAIVKAAELELQRLTNRGTGDYARQMEELRKQLELAKKAEEDAAEALAQKKLDGIKVIDAEKLALQASITAKEAERTAINMSIAAEFLRIDAIQKERMALIAQMETVGTVRKSEKEKIDETIESLLKRRAALEEERIALEALIKTIKDNPIIPPDMKPIEIIVTINDAGDYNPTKKTLVTIGDTPAITTTNYSATAPSFAGTNTGASAAVSDGLQIGNMELHIHVDGTSGTADIGKTAAEKFVSAFERNGELIKRMKRAIR